MTIRKRLKHWWHTRPVYAQFRIGWALTGHSILKTLRYVRKQYARKIRQKLAGVTAGRSGSGAIKRKGVKMIKRAEDRCEFIDIIKGINTNSEAILERVDKLGGGPESEKTVALVQLTRAVLVLASIPMMSE